MGNDARTAHTVVAPGEWTEVTGSSQPLPVAYFRAVALDYDGTLADGAIAVTTLEALAEVRRQGIKVILVTGRIMAELRTVFPHPEDHVDAIVAENGALVFVHGTFRARAPAVDPAVGQALTARGVPHRTGQVLIACQAADEAEVTEVIRDLGLDCQLLRNRGELMVLPAGVTKGGGLREALADLGLSPHNTIGVGDAENDHSLFDMCEIGVAVNNAVGSLQARADVKLSLPDGAGVVELLRGPLLSGEQHLYPRHWQIILGTDSVGDPVTLPASQLNVAVCGGTGDGKSYLAGLMCEQLVNFGYSLVVVDPEGDHAGLGALYGVLVTGGDEDALTPPADVAALLRAGSSTMVVDLSELDPAAQASYESRLMGELEAHRYATGIPQWTVIDEAHGPAGRSGTLYEAFDPSSKGYLLVTWKPELLSAESLAALDVVVALTSPHPDAHLVDIAAAVADMPRAEMARLVAGPTGNAVLAWRARQRQAVKFTPRRRVTPHLRHEHKYGHGGVGPNQGFYFRTEPDIATGAVASNLTELEAELARCDRGVLVHHCPRHDFSHWVAEVFRDPSLAADIAAAESQVTGSSHNAVVQQARLALIAGLQARHYR